MYYKYVAFEKDCTSDTYHFCNYRTFSGAVWPGFMHLATALQRFLTRRVEAIVPWHLTVSGNVSEFIWSNVFVAVISFTDCYYYEMENLYAGGHLTRHTELI